MKRQSRAESPWDLPKHGRSGLTCIFNGGRGHLAAERKECRRAPIWVLSLTQRRVLHPVLSPREQMASLVEAESPAPSKQGFVLTAWKVRVVAVGVFLSALSATRQTQHWLGNVLYCVFRFSASVLHWLTNSKTKQTISFLLFSLGAFFSILLAHKRASWICLRVNWSGLCTAHVLWRPCHLLSLCV